MVIVDGPHLSMALRKDQVRLKVWVGRELQVGEEGLSWLRTLRDLQRNLDPIRFRFATSVAPNLAWGGDLARPARIAPPARSRRSEVQGTCMHASIQTYIHACTHTYTHTYIHTYTHAHTHTHMHTPTHAHIHTCIHAQRSAQRPMPRRPS